MLTKYAKTSQFSINVITFFWKNDWTIEFWLMIPYQPQKNRSELYIEVTRTDSPSSSAQENVFWFFFAAKLYGYSLLKLFFPVKNWSGQSKAFSTIWNLKAVNWFTYYGTLRLCSGLLTPEGLHFLVRENSLENTITPWFFAIFREKYRKLAENGEITPDYTRLRPMTPENVAKFRRVQGGRIITDKFDSVELLRPSVVVFIADGKIRFGRIITAFSGRFYYGRKNPVRSH